DGRHLMRRVLDADLRAGQGLGELACEQGTPSKIDAGDHGTSLGARAPARRGVPSTGRDAPRTPGRSSPRTRPVTMVAMSSPRDARPVEISDDVIRLGQFLKLAGLAESDAEARELVTEGEVRVNGEVDTRRGRQLHRGDVVSVDRPQGSESATVA